MSKNKKLNAWEFIHSPFSNTDVTGVKNNILKSANNNYMYYNLFTNIVLSLFKWENIPHTMDSEYLEWCLFFEGKACVIKNAVGDLVNLRYSENSKPDIYQKPNSIIAYSDNDRQVLRNKGEFVICKNNKLYTPSVIVVNYFCDKIKNIENTIDTNVYSQKMPTLFKGKKEKQKTLLNAFNQFNANQPYMFVDEDFTEDVKLETLTSDTKFIAKELYDLKDRYKQEFFTFLGINNANTQKAERLITDEVNANNQFISLNFDTMLQSRLQFCKDLKNIFGVEINVKPAIESVILNNDKGGENV